MITTSKKVENFIESDDNWFSDIETKVLDLENELSEWRESRTRELGYGSESPPRREREMLRATGNAQRGGNDGPTAAGRRRAGAAAGYARPIPERQSRHATERAQALIDHGRRTARRPRSRRGYKIAIGTAAGVVLLVIGATIVLRKGPSWPPSVATVRSEITTACQNPNVASEPSQVNFACGTDTSQVLWVFALMTSSDNPGYADAKTGRKGLEPITAAQGGQIAWLLNLHHPYDPLSPVDSLAVAARAINNIIGGATLTGANGKPGGPAGAGEQAGELRQVHRVARHHLARRVPQPVRQPGDQPGGPGGARRRRVSAVDAGRHPGGRAERERAVRERR